MAGTKVSLSQGRGFGRHGAPLPTRALTTSCYTGTQNSSQIKLTSGHTDEGAAEVQHREIEKCTVCLLFVRSHRPPRAHSYHARYEEGNCAYNNFKINFNQITYSLCPDLLECFD
jgi:hypothetical protein